MLKLPLTTPRRLLTVRQFHYPLALRPSFPPPLLLAPQPNPYHWDLLSVLEEMIKQILKPLPIFRLKSKGIL